MLSKIGTVAGLLVALLASGAFLVARAAPENRPALATPPVQQAAAGDSFVPTCKADQVVDTRPDPAWVGASFANDNCSAPVIPARLDGYDASSAQVNAAIAAEKKYEGAAKAYQRCIEDYVTARSIEAKNRKMTLDATLVTIENHRIAASQANIKKAYELMALTVDQFNELGSECPD